MLSSNSFGSLKKELLLVDVQLIYSCSQIQKMCNLRYVKSNLLSMLARQILTEPHAQMNLLLIIKL